VVFVHDAPTSILLAEPHGEAKFEIDFLAGAQVATSANRSGKGHLGARCDSDVVKIELHRPGCPVVEHIPRRHVCVQPTGQERWGDIEHQDVGVVISANACEVLVTDRLGPSGDQCAKFRFIRRRLGGLCCVWHLFLASHLTVPRTPLVSSDRPLHLDGNSLHFPAGHQSRRMLAHFRESRAQNDILLPVTGRGSVGSNNKNRNVAEFCAQSLLKSPTVKIRDVYCQGSCRGKSAEEFATATELVFPYRGAFMRHLGSDQAVAEANQVMFFNAAEGYRISHPVPGGDASLSLAISEEQLLELAPATLLCDKTTPAFRGQRLRIDARAQVLVALLRHSLREDIAEPLEAESLALTLIRRALGPRTTHEAGASLGRQRLVDRVKLVLASDLTRRWTLAEIAAEVRGSPVYLTQVFQQVEGMPLYRYQLRLRLARALDLLAQYDDLTSLSLDLGFSSHSHFSAAFREAYGRSPSEFKQSALRR
jgi:AraC family transcriptional regulator